MGAGGHPNDIQKMPVLPDRLLLTIVAKSQMSSGEKTLNFHLQFSELENRMDLKNIKLSLVETSHMPLL